MAHFPTSIDQLPLNAPLPPNRYRLVAGRGNGPTMLNAFDRALLCAGVGNYNLVKVSSIFPPYAQAADLTMVPAGSIIHAALATAIGSQRGESLSAAVAAGIPTDPNFPGVLMEGSFRCSVEEAEERVREMARTAIADRGLDLLSIESVAAECTVEEGHGAAIAAILLWRS